MANTTWQLDAAHSEVTFRVRHLVIATVSGKFDKFTSSVTNDGDDFTNANIEFAVDTASVNTGVEARDNHLRGDDFFNSEKFPQMTFKSTSLKKLGADDYQLDGNLTIRDVTKPISLKVEFGGTATDPYGNRKAGFEVTGTLNRKEFGLRWDAVTEAGGAVVSDEVKIQANVQYAKAQS
ncbi:MAG: YceI family protein [Saprospiraceae bacterium]|nr:YceI family protein [Saprospiraceae bacterium]